MLYNNQNPYTSAMIVPNIQAVNRAIESKGFKPGTEEGNRLSVEIIQGEINAYRAGGKYAGMFTERWLPATFVILPESFNEENKLLNSTLKIVRGKIVEYFDKQLAFLYTSEAKNIYNTFNFEALNKLNKK
jgi:long-chain acyl-CoA synthetase